MPREISLVLGNCSISLHFAQCPLDGGKLGDVTEMTGYAEIFGAGEFGLRDQMRENF